MGHQADLQFGKLAVMRNLVTQAQFEECVALQQRNAAAGLEMTLRELLERKGYLKAADIPALAAEQEYMAARADDIQFGQIAIDNGFVSRKQVREMLDRQAEEHKRSKGILRLAAMLAEAGALNAQQTRAVLKAQERVRAQAAGTSPAPSAATAAPKPAPAPAPAPANPPSEQDDVATINELSVPWLKQGAPKTGDSAAPPPSDQDGIRTLGEIAVPWLKPAADAPKPEAGPPAPPAKEPSEQDGLSTIDELAVPWLKQGEKKPPPKAPEK